MIKNLLKLLFPSICNGCDTVLLNNEAVICSKCRHDLPYTNHHLVRNNETFKKFYGRLPVIHASSIVYFNKKGIVQQLIHNLKYKGAEEVGTFFGEIYGEELLKIHSTEKFDAVIPVPLHKKRLKERGYNQVTQFGSILSERLSIPYEDGLLNRNFHSKTQTKKNLLGRTDVNTSLFEANYTEKDHGKHFLLIDDVITSGATLEACGKALLKIPDARVSILTMAFAHS
ncbi:MAG TPA: phosphoribosyltransferase family protein [Flavobacterium sp.]|uniref:ComF family protein n=1 Tax=Flavobacterium sp. TaxID=239 RepID=UPI002C5847A0|nr:phosphoribosyltransferase family protein [Flavobacterium sp.]HSD15509.1 phosphoribosyltransferase family protein [Flavobacterium sp.]